MLRLWKVKILEERLRLVCESTMRTYPYHLDLLLVFIQQKCLSRVIYTKPMTSKKHVVLEKAFAEVHG